MRKKPNVQETTPEDEAADLPVEEDPPVPRPGDEEPEQELLDGEREGDPEKAADSPRKSFATVPVETSGRPPWAKIPKGMRFRRGLRVFFLRFRAEWTAAPHKGDRQCVLWELTDIEEVTAAQRTLGSPGRGLHEFAKQSIRVIDGLPADWSGIEGPANVDTFWREIGPRCRTLIASFYQEMSALTARERDDFFSNCVAARSVA